MHPPVCTLMARTAARAVLRQQNTDANFPRHFSELFFRHLFHFSPPFLPFRLNLNQAGV